MDEPLRLTHLCPSCDAFLLPFPLFPVRNRAQCRRALDDLPGSVADFTRAIQLDPSDVMSHVQRGHRCAKALLCHLSPPISLAL
jgi:hypothetical protein